MKDRGVVLGLTVMLGAGACSGPSASSVDEPGGTTASSDDALVGIAAIPDAYGVIHGGYGRELRSRQVAKAIGKAADRLSALQADITGDNARNGLVDIDPDDGGWDFTLPAAATAHTKTASPPNLFGETGFGAWIAVDSGAAGNRALVTALDAGTGMVDNPDVDSPPDFAFGVLLGDLADNPGFAQVARAHYDAKKAANGGATGLGDFIRDGRHSRNEDGLIAYDVGWLTLSAEALDAAFPGNGYAADAAIYAHIVVDDLTSVAPRFDINNAAEAFYVIGLSWSQVAAATVGNRALLGRLRGVLLGQQRSDGAWGTNSAQPADDLQSTAIALETLAISDRATLATLVAEQRATRFLLRGQAASGGWPDASGIELPLVDAEIMLGLALSHGDVGQDDPSSPFVVGPLVVAPAAGPAAPSP